MTIFQEFSISDLFEEIKVSKRILKRNLKPTGKTPCYSSQRHNNGRVGYCLDEPDFLIDSNRTNYVIFGDHTKTMHIVNESFCVTDNVKVLLPRLNQRRVLQYIFVQWKKAIPSKGYARHWSEAKHASITLPVLRRSGSFYDLNDIDLEYIENTMRGYEQKCLANMLSRSTIAKQVSMSEFDLTDTELSNNEKIALEHVREQKGMWKKFRLGDLFDKLPTKYTSKEGRRPEISDRQTEIFSLPLVSAKKSCNGINAWSRPTDFPSFENTISIIYNGAVSAGLAYYQKDKTGILSDSYLLQLKEGKLSLLSGLYFATAIERAVYQKYSRDHKATWSNRVENEEILLPVTTPKNTESQDFEIIDFALIESYMSALAKQVISHASDISARKAEIAEAFLKS